MMRKMKMTMPMRVSPSEYPPFSCLKPNLAYPSTPVPA